MVKKINYTESFEELQNIVSEIEAGNISIDLLSENVKRATQLIQICKNILFSTEEDVQNILNELNLRENENNNE
ncbi:MAG: exodeoxyribonuclease VII small subunit [Chitinophagaceae bacterium]